MSLDPIAIIQSVAGTLSVATIIGLVTLNRQVIILIETTANLKAYLAEQKTTFNLEIVRGIIEKEVAKKPNCCQHCKESNENH